MKSRKEQRKRFAQLKREGWTIERSGSGHYKMVHPNGGIVIAPFSPSASGSWRQIEKHIAAVERGEPTGRKP
jgi:predicted RNA binding protein YcfA (HicA-like mRNA interferase family)